MAEISSLTEGDIAYFSLAGMEGGGMEEKAVVR